MLKPLPVTSMWHRVLEFLHDELGIIWLCRFQGFRDVPIGPGAEAWEAQSPGAILMMLTV